jgi:hypothetical protein
MQNLFLDAGFARSLPDLKAYAGLPAWSGRFRYTKARKELHFSSRLDGLIVEARLSLGCSQAKTWKEA